MKLSIPLDKLYYKYIILYLFSMDSVSTAPTTVHNWIQKTDLQLGGKAPDHVGLNETVIRLNDERLWPRSIPESTTFCVSTSYGVSDNAHHTISP